MVCLCPDWAVPSSAAYIYGPSQDVALWGRHLFVLQGRLVPYGAGFMHATEHVFPRRHLLGSP